MTKPRIFTMPFVRVYPEYIAKAKRKGRTKEEVDEIIRWLTGYNQKEFEHDWKWRQTLKPFIMKHQR